MVPVPAAMTPRVKLISQSADTEIYMVSTQSGNLNLRSDMGTKYKRLKSYKKGTEVIVLNKATED